MKVLFSINLQTKPASIIPPKTYLLKKHRITHKNIVDYQ